jgi:hypothetical protein
MHRPTRLPSFTELLLGVLVTSTLAVSVLMLT